MASRPFSLARTYGPGPFSRAPELLIQEQAPANPFGAGATRGLPDISQALLTLNQTAQDRAAEQPQQPKVIDKLKPGSGLHNAVRTKLDAMARFSENRMRQHYDRWNWMEMKVQAYLHNQDYDSLINETIDRDTNIAQPPEPVQLVIPYTYATLHAANTYINTVLAGRKPMFPLMANRGTATDRARHMETVLQHNMDASNGQEMIWQKGWDSLLYGFSGVRIGWSIVNGQQVKISPSGERSTQEGITFAGNELTNIDPYRCFPDPRVPLHKCPDKGDFIFTQESLSEMALKDMETAGVLKWTEAALSSSLGRENSQSDNSANTRSQRRIRIGGETDLREQLSPKDVVGFREVFEGTVRLIPKDWGLGDSTTSELWKFIWMRNGQIMQAEPLGMIHGQHPYVFGEPTSLGYDFMSLSQAEMISTFQDVLSWLISSRMENVRSSIENSFIADPARVEINDMRSSSIGRIIRLKQSAMGLPINQAIQQVVVNDVTGSHFSDVNVVRMLADTATGVNDSLRGIEQGSGRRSATEARMTIQAGASRLSQLAVRLSSQSLQPMAKQMIFNIQQFMPKEFWEQISDDPNNSLTMDMLVGDFNYQVSDGTLPLDKAALTETWKEILFGIARDPELRQQFSIPDIFKHVAELGGAKDIERFKKQQALPQAQPNPAGNDNLTPVGTALPSTVPQIGAM